MIFTRFCLGFILLFTGCSAAEVQSHEDELRSKLLRDYNPRALPAPHTKVQMRVIILHYTMNEKLQSLDTDLWLSMTWNDPRLAWNPDDHPDIVRIAFDMEQVWYPDLTIYNSIGGDVNSVQSSTKILISAINGSAMWVPPSHAKAMCAMDMTYWPYDVHNCSINIGSWVHSAASIDLNAMDDTVDVEMMYPEGYESNISRSEWTMIESRVLRTSKKYDCCPDDYVSVRASMVLQRNGKSHWWLYQMPIIVMGILVVVVFVLPPTAGEKVILAAITFFVNLVFLITLSETIGHTSTHTPLIVQLASLQLVYSGVAVIASSVILRLVRDPHSSRVPSGMKSLSMGLAKIMCLDGYRQMAKSSLSHEAIMKGEDLELNEGMGRTGHYSPNSKETDGADWLLAAAVLDRACFLAFLALFVINMVSFSVIL